MKNNQVDEFHLRFNRLRKIAQQIILSGSDEDRTRFALCQNEFVNWSDKVKKLIDKIVEKDHDLTEKDLDDLLRDLVYIKILLYDEIVPWIIKLRDPLKKAIDEVEDMLDEFEKKNKANEG
jgi:hypothetical protein